MRTFLLFTFLSASQLCNAQDGPVNALPPGKYETIIKSHQDKWDRGDIIILNDNRYRISTSDEIGEYRFSVTAQRVFFTSGPLKGFFAKTSLSNNAPAIILPLPENEQKGLKLPSEVWCYYRER